MPTYDFACSCGAVTEERRGYDDMVIPCPSCGATASRVPVYRHQYIVGATVARPNISRYQEMGAELDYAHTKAESEVGHELPSPNYHKHAMARAEGINPNFRASQENNKLRKRAKRRELAEAAAAEGSTLRGTARA